LVATGITALRLVVAQYYHLGGKDEMPSVLHQSVILRMKTAVDLFNPRVFA
jgi:hypothetical protein